LLLLQLLVVVVVVDVVDVVDDLQALAAHIFHRGFLSDLLLLLLLLLRWGELRGDGDDVVVGALQNRFDGLVCVGLLRGQVKVLLDEVSRGRPVAECVLKHEVRLG